MAAALCAARDGALSPVITGEYRSGDVRHIVADPARAAEVLGFRAAVDPREGLRQIRVRAAALDDALVSDAMPDPDDLVTVVLPCLNEEESLPAVLAAIPAGYRALVVDNNSTDNTARVAASRRSGGR